MTDGVLLRESLNDPDLNKYSAIVVSTRGELSFSMCKALMSGFLVILL